MELASLEIKVARSENLPVLPQVATAVLRMADDPNASARNLEKLIERDPALAGKTLRVANSSYYGLSNASTITRAISILGLNTIRSLVISVSYQQMISGRVAANNFDKLAFWSHSLATATAARILGKMQMPEKAEELYLAGMMHDVGYLVMDRFYPGELDEAIRLAHEENTDVAQAEQKVFGFDHGDVGGMLARKWGLPALLEKAIQFHHRVDEDTEYQATTAIVAVANHIAKKGGLVNNNPPGCELADSTAMSLVGLPEQQLTVVSEVMLQEVEKAQAAFSIQAAA